MLIERQCQYLFSSQQRLENGRVCPSKMYANLSNISTSQKNFTTFIRDEQVAKNAHIMCLPLDIRIYILICLHENNILKVYRNIFEHRNLLEHDGTRQLLRESRAYRTRRNAAMQRCNCLIKQCFNVPKRFEEKFSLIILAQSDTKARYGTYLGKYIVAIIDEYRTVQDLPDDVNKLLIYPSVELNVTCHRAALFARNRTNPFEDNCDHVEIELNNNKIHKIWWVDTGVVK